MNLFGTPGMKPRFTLLVTAVIAVGCSPDPRWQTADSGHLIIPVGQAYIDDIRPFEDRRIRVTISEENGLPVVAFWLNPEEHEQAQAGALSEGLDDAMDRNMFLRGSGGDVVGETTIPQGLHYLYFQQDETSEPIELNLDYKIEVFR
ncbi:MAG: hypothetical protein AAFP18_04955 [Bacteroidota bacterium]